ncbi:MAG: hypothetical protein RL662_1935 [Bacteroidota bacterium]|jgi:dipeptidyl-peptidase-4
MKVLKPLHLFLYILFAITMMGQNNQNQLSLEDLIPGGKSYAKYQVSFPKQLQWWGDTPVYVKGDSILAISTREKDKVSVILTKGLLNEGLSQQDQLKTLVGFSFPYPNQRVVLFSRNNKTYLYDYGNKRYLTTFDISKEAINTDFSKESKSIAYTKSNNLYVMDMSGKEIAVSAEADKGIVTGQSVHRNEFGISKGTFWSPTGNQLAFYRMDESMVSDYPLVDVSARIAALKSIKYPMAGMRSHHVSVGVCEPTSGKTVFLKTETPKEKYLTNIAWSPDTKWIYIAEVNRGQDTCQLVRYDASSGKRDAIIFTETHSKYVEPENPIVFLKKDPTSFVWQSKRSGNNHFYLYTVDGILKKQLTSGNWDVTEFLGFDSTGDNLYYTSTEVSCIEKHIYQLNLNTGKRTRLSNAEGVHRASLSPSGTYLIDTYTSKRNAGTILLTDTEKKTSTVFFQAPHPYQDTPFPQIDLGVLMADDTKTALHYRLVKPTGFDPNKKYPLIIYVYGGPHSQLVDNSWLGQVRGWDIYMAQKGYLVFTLDNRGTKNRGFDFENITHRHLGVIETQDQMTGVSFLKTLPYVDSERIGVHGWSYGGFMTLNLMLRHPDVFKVGVAGGPVTDWKYYEAMYGERYMDLPKENPDGYAETNMVQRAGDLKGRLMLIHGDEDPVVVMQHSLQFLKSAIKKGTHPDFFVYPGHEHNMIGHDRVHLHQHITRYFDDYLIK